MNVWLIFDWLVLVCVWVCVIMCSGGVSQVFFDSLNFGVYVDDDLCVVEENC